MNKSCAEMLKDLSQDMNIIRAYQKIYSEKLDKISRSDGGGILREIIRASNVKSFEEKNFLKMSEEDKNILSKTALRYFGLLKEVVRVLVRENNSENLFYERLYQKIFDSDLFSQNCSERGILVFLLARRVELLPYYQAQNSINMSEEETDTVFDKIVNSIEVAMFMLNDRFSSVIEEAEELVDISDKLENDKERSVFWASIISRLRRETRMRKEDRLRKDDKSSED